MKYNGKEMKFIRNAKNTTMEEHIKIPSKVKTFIVNTTLYTKGIAIFSVGL